MLLMNKKGDFVIDVLVILVLLVIYFAFANPLQTLINDISTFTTDSNILWMIRGFPFLILIGIVRWVFINGRETP